MLGLWKILTVGPKWIVEPPSDWKKSGTGLGRLDESCLMTMKILLRPRTSSTCLDHITNTL